MRGFVPQPQSYFVTKERAPAPMAHSIPVTEQLPARDTSKLLDWSQVLAHPCSLKRNQAYQHMTACRPDSTCALPDMQTLTFFFCGALASLALGLGPAVAASQETWPLLPKLIELPTPYGTLAVSESEYVYEARLKLNGVEVEPEIKGMLNISHAFSMPEAQAALVVINQGNDNCPVSYRWVVLKPTGYTISPEFGSCSEHIRVTADTARLTVQTPSRDRPGALDVYVYDGKTVKREMRKVK